MCVRGATHEGRESWTAASFACCCAWLTCMRCVLCESQCVRCCEREREPPLQAKRTPYFSAALFPDSREPQPHRKASSSPTILGPFLASGLRTTTQRSPHSLCHQRFLYLLLRLLTSLCLLIVPYPFLFTHRSPNTLVSHRRHSFDPGFIYSSIVLVRAFHPAPLLLCLSHIPRRSVPVSTFSVHRLATVAASARHSWKKGSGPEARKEGGCCRDGIVHRYQLQGLAPRTLGYTTTTGAVSTALWNIDAGPDAKKGAGRPAAKLQHSLTPTICGSAAQSRLAG